MVAAKSNGVVRRSRQQGKRVERAKQVRADIAPERPSEATAATQVAWGAVKEAVRSTKAQPATAVRATGSAVSKVAKSGAKQTALVADAISRALDEVLMSAMSEARAAAKAAREAAREVEKSVDVAMNAIRIAVRKRALAVVNQATREARRAPATKTMKRARPRAG